VRRWVPKGLADRPTFVFETGGSTGVPKSRISVDDFRIDYDMFSETLPEKFFPKGADWLHVGPSGPRRLRLAVEHLCQHRGGICFMVDLDPRWVIKLIKWGEMAMMERYKQHVVDQALTLLRAHDTIRCLFTTPKLLEALSEGVAAEDGHHRCLLRGHGDDAAVPPLRRRGLLGPDVYFAPTYGNTLMGLAVHRPAPRATAGTSSTTRGAPGRHRRRAARRARPCRGYGATGRVRLTTLTKSSSCRSSSSATRPARASLRGLSVGRRAQRAPVRAPGGAVVEGVY
jgi:hypothetical protein